VLQVHPMVLQAYRCAMYGVLVGASVRVRVPQANILTSPPLRRKPIARETESHRGTRQMSRALLYIYKKNT
jgi:hypothetical protein